MTDCCLRFWRVTPQSCIVTTAQASRAPRRPARHPSNSHICSDSHSRAQTRCILFGLVMGLRRTRIRPKFKFRLLARSKSCETKSRKQSSPSSLSLRPPSLLGFPPTQENYLLHANDSHGKHLASLGLPGSRLDGTATSTAASHHKPGCLR